MGSQRTWWTWLVHAGEILALAAVYFALGRLGLAMEPVNGFASLVWAPAGLSLAALVLGGFRLWPGVALGALATNLWAGAPLISACGIAAGNTLEAVAATFALERIPGFEGSLDRFAEVIGLAVLAAMLSTMISASVGTASLRLGGVITAAEFGRTWRVWWAGDVIGDLVIAPLLLTWARGPRVSFRPAASAETAALGVVLVGCAALVFVQWPEAATENPILQPYVLFLPLIWAAVRFGARGAATGTFVVAVIAIWNTFTGLGAFVRSDRPESLIALHVFLASAALASLILGAVVSEREKSRRELREGASMLRTVVEGTIDAVYVKDRLGRYLMVNPAGARMLEASPAAMAGEDDTRWFPPDDARRLAENDQRVMRTGQPRTFEESVTVAGTNRVFHTTKAPYRDAEGKVIGIIGVSRDITERKRIEQEWRESEERQRLAVEAADLGMWCWDVKQDRLEWTALCRRMHGIGPDEELDYARFLAALHPEDRERTQGEVLRALDQRTDYRIEHRVVWPDGSVRWLSVLGRAFYDDAGAPDRMLGVTLDVTARKQAEEERAELLAREQEARAEAQAATRAKDDFLAVLSHELRTPLQSMLGWTQVMRARTDERARQKALDTIERNVRTQAKLIEDLLDVSRIAAGKLRLGRARVDLGEVVASSVESVRAAADAGSIRLDASIEPLPGMVLGDRDRLQQVVSNLLTNAVKFTPAGGRIDVRLRNEDGSARIVVEDSGRGISPEFLPQVFERFRQANGGGSRRLGGLGLGLAIVRHLVEEHGGTVTAASPGEGRGATFTVTLPLVSGGPRAVTAERGRPAPRDPGASVSLAGVRVLVVDDDPDACELLEVVLRERGAVVRAVHSAREALDELSSFRPNLLLSDIGMPDEDGYDLIRQVRARESAEGGHLPAVALTGFASSADGEQARALGFEAHLAKPASPGELTRMVAILVGRAA
jgi:PAS domain S-box-containing protein